MRTWQIRGLALGLGGLLAGATLHAATGMEVAGMASYDSQLTALMGRWNLPGLAVAVVRDGRLIFSRGYGVADPATGAPLEPRARFRVASLSKPLTAAAVLRLVDQGRLRLDTPAFALLNLGPPADARLAQITVRHLLQHSAGWDSALSGDPMFAPRSVAAAMGVASPPDAATVVRYLVGRPLDFAPGSRYAYANVGYTVLGRVIEAVTGQPYETHVREMLADIGITRMRTGHSLRAEREADEVVYQADPGLGLTDSVYDRAPGRVAWPDGGFALESMDAHGGWVGSAVDMAVFASALGSLAQRRLLSDASVAALADKPAYVPGTAVDWYGLGWQVNNYGNAWHTGSLPGSTSLVVRTQANFQWVLLTHTRPEDPTQRERLAQDIDQTMWNALRGVTAWPSGNQLSGEAALADLGTRSGRLHPAWADSTRSYSLALPAGTTQLTLHPRASQADAVLRVNGTVVDAANPSITLPLTGLATPVTLSVTAQDGSARQTTTLWALLPLASHQTDCLLGWAERQFPQWFSPAGSPSVDSPPYRYRHYPATGHAVGTSSDDQHAWALGPAWGPQPVDLGPAAEFLAPAGCAH